MKLLTLTALTALSTAPALAQETRDLDAHVHGTSTLTLAVEGGALDVDLTAPGMDIVGFEHAAQSEADKAAVAAAIAALEEAGGILTLPDAAGCTLTSASAVLLGEDADHDHDHAAEAGEHDYAEEDHAHDAAAEGEHDHDAAAEGEHDHAEEDHAHDATAEGEHDHAEEDHAHDATAEGEHDHAEGDHAHDAAAEGEHDHDHAEAGNDHGGHAAFQASYAFACEDPAALTEITFPFFDQFAGASVIDAQYVTDAGAGRADITRDAATLTLN